MDREDVDLVAASLDDKPVLQRLVELYMHDFSELNGRDVNEHGQFGYRYLDHYWTEPERHPFLFRKDGRWIGFALLRIGGTNSVAEFFVLRKYRRAGLGASAARLLFAQFPGHWEVEQIRANEDARSFWHHAIPVAFTEHETEDGWRQVFDITT